MTTEQQTTTDHIKKGTKVLFVNLLTFALFERERGLLDTKIPRAISTEISKAKFIAYHIDNAITYILIKKAYDSLSPEDRENFKARFMWIRKHVLLQCDEGELRQAAKYVKNHPDLKLGGFAESEISNDPKEKLTLVEIPLEFLEEYAPKARETPVEAIRQKEPLRIPIASPEAVEACVALLHKVLENIRQSYLYNAERIVLRAAQLEEGKQFSEEEIAGAMFLSIGPLVWIKHKHPALYSQIQFVEAAIESAAVIGSFDATEQAAQRILSLWQKALGSWQYEVDKFFPNLNNEEKATSKDA